MTSSRGYQAIHDFFSSFLSDCPPLSSVCCILCTLCILHCLCVILDNTVLLIYNCGWHFYLAIGWLVLRLGVLILAACVSLSLSVINSSINTSFHVLIIHQNNVSWLVWFHVVLWCSLREVKYSYFRWAWNWFRRKACSWGRYITM